MSSEGFKHLRVYRRLSIPLLLNDIACNRLMKLNKLVDKAPSMYRTATRYLGKNLINSIVHSTYCKVFTAGNTVAEANECAKFYQEQGNPSEM
jgi:hypothetical protein